MAGEDGMRTVRRWYRAFEYRGVHRATGRELVAESCHVWTPEDDRITAFRQFTEVAAFAAAMEEVPGRVR